MFWPSVLLVAVCAGYGFFGARFVEQWQSIAVAVAALVLAVVGWLFPLLGWLSRNYTITTRRIVLRRGVFVREHEELLHSRGYSVMVRRGWLQSLFRSGDIVVSSSTTRLVLADVPAVALVNDTLHELMEWEAADRPAASIG